MVEAEAAVDGRVEGAEAAVAGRVVGAVEVVMEAEEEGEEVSQRRLLRS